MKSVTSSVSAAGRRLDAAFYRRPDVVAIARELLGMYLVTALPGPDGPVVVTAGQIVETEAYNGTTDRACHAYGARRTRRTEVMYAPGGTAYVYLIYGMYELFNVVTNAAGTPDAVLVRALVPAEGLETMRRRRGYPKPEKRLTAGPGVLTRALGMGRAQNGTSLTAGAEVWIEDRGARCPAVVSGPRINVGYAGPDADLPYRFGWAGSPWLSKPF